MELGPIQKAWLKNLREHPERQMQDQLGRLTPDGGYEACCLGEALLTLHRAQGTEDSDMFNRDDTLYDHNAMDTLESSYDELGLHDETGSFLHERLDDEASLAEANDAGYSWLAIADFIEENPETVFSRSV